jgi:2-(1,2-epoxy-1,2-dihydrophenyl)acetyl-CoA isomerase
MTADARSDTAGAVATGPGEKPPPVVRVVIGDDHVATIELCRPPNNFFSLDLIGGVADALAALDDTPACRAAVLCAQGKHFCAGADFSGDGASYTTEDLYAAAVRIFRAKTPIVAAVQGAAIGGGLGLALSADFRVAAPEARFSANFARLGFHQGFGLSVTLPRLLGPQAAAELLYTGRRVKGDEAVALGLADRLAPLEEIRAVAHDLAREIAISAPLAIESIRSTLRGDLADQVAAATAHELTEQVRLRATEDFAEGARAMAERRPPVFRGR